MKITSIACFVAAILLGAVSLQPGWAQSDAPSSVPPAPSPQDPTKYQVETKWSGVDYQIVDLRRISPNRLLVCFYIYATKDVPAAGIFMGKEVLPPSGTKLQDINKYVSTGVSLLGAVMTDDLSQTQYPTLRPLTLLGYFPHNAFGRIFPLRKNLCSLQFAVPPPPPPPPPGQPAPIQTLSFMIPQAIGPISHIPIPPPTKPAAGAAAASTH